MADDVQMAESQLSELRNMRVLLEEARVLARNLAYHRRARLEKGFGHVLDEIDRQIEELRRDRGRWHQRLVSRGEREVGIPGTKTRRPRGKMVS